MGLLQGLIGRTLDGLRKKSDSAKVADDLDKGKKINYSPKSLRFTYSSSDDTDLDKNWKPETVEEKERLSPDGYFRIGERNKEEKALKEGIKDAALRKSISENPDYLFSQHNEDAEKEADKTFKDNYNLKNVSVPSTAIKNINYDPDTEGLTITFQSSNKEYFYPAVPLELVQALLKAPSKGEFFMNNIHNQYSMYRNNHSKKSDSQQKAIKHYVKKYMASNKGKWKNK